MRRKKRRGNKRKILIIFSICFLFLMSAGYAAFQTSLGIGGETTITGKIGISTNDLKDLAVTSGDGIYKDKYETGRYIYKGANPNNYITFNNEVWRIMSVESDGTIKIMRSESIEKMKFDSKGLRTTGYCSQGALPLYGCNAWGTMDNFVRGNYSGSVDADSELNTYLNGEYYNSLTSISKKLIVNHDFSVGPVEYRNSDLAGQIESENTYKWNGKIGIMTVSEYLRSNTNTDMCGNQSLINSNYSTCQSTNYIISLASNTSGFLWTISPYVADADVFIVLSNGNVDMCSVDASNGAASPVVYLTSDITLVGDGTSSNPYVIN